MYSGAADTERRMRKEERMHARQPAGAESNSSCRRAETGLSQRLNRATKLVSTVIFLGALACCDAIVAQKEITMKDKLQYFEHFCFDDGSMQLFIKLECADCRVGTSLLICTEDELDRIRNDRGRTDTSDPCSDGRDWGICEKHYFVSDTLNLTKAITQPARSGVTKLLRADFLLVAADHAWGPVLSDAVMSDQQQPRCPALLRVHERQRSPELVRAHLPPAVALALGLSCSDVSGTDM
eukprot:1476628-Rhodomonas_salina.1